MTQRDSRGQVNSLEECVCTMTLCTHAKQTFSQIAPEWQNMVVQEMIDATKMLTPSLIQLPTTVYLRI